MSSKLIRNLPVLDLIAHTHSRTRKSILRELPVDVINSLSELACNTLNGNIPLNNKVLKQLYNYRNHLRCLGSRKYSCTSRRKILLSQQGGGLLGLLLGPILKVAKGLFGSLLSGNE